MSSEDIKKGTRWSPAVAKELAESRAAIFCLTPDNLESPWLNFEAGAVSNTPWSANVCTYLFNVTSSDITGPLNQFQWTVATSKDENLKLLAAINGAQEDDALDQKRLEKAFNTYWPELETALTEISEAKLPHLAKRSLEDIAEETLNIVRDLQKQSVQPLVESIMAPVQAWSGLDNISLLKKLMIANNNCLADESINTGLLYSKGRLTPPPAIPHRKSDNRLYSKGRLTPPPAIPPRKSEKPKDK
jgi:hypothetical protein